jgi:SanA protein
MSAVAALLRLFIYALVLVGAVIVLCVLYVVGITRAVTYESPDTLPKEEVVLVLGASIKKSGQLSPVLAERADAALLLYKNQVVSKILVSGDSSTPGHDEVLPVGKYLMNHGVPQKDIFLDYAGLDTYSSIYRAQKVFGATSVVIASQQFHLPRALYIARRLGMSAVGLDVSTQNQYFTQSALREIPAIMKAVADLASARNPMWDGKTFPVQGDGTVTWRK